MAELKDWTEPDSEGNIDVPDELMPLFNKIGMQIRFHTISGANEVLTIARMVKAAQKFFEGRALAKTSNDASALPIPDVSGSALIREDCPFKLKPCNYTGRGWYDRCAWCKDNNSFIRPKEDSSKPF